MSFQKRPLNRLVTSSILFPSKIHEHGGVCRKRVCLSQHARSSLTALLLSLLVQGWFSQHPLLQIRGNRYEQLRLQAKELEANCKLISEAVESLIRIQSKNLDQQLFNKANEIQEEISRKRFDLRCAQIQLAGIRAQVYYN